MRTGFCNSAVSVSGKHSPAKILLDLTPMEDVRDEEKASEGEESYSIRHLRILYIN